MQLKRRNILSSKDERVIKELVFNNPDVAYIELIEILNQIFGKNITSKHYVVLGMLIGASLATEKVLDEIYNNLSLCQRQN